MTETEDVPVEQAVSSEEPPGYDEDGNELAPPTPEQIARIRETTGFDVTGGVPAAAQKYGCNHWAYTGDFVACGTVAFGYSSLYVYNCSPGTWGAVFVNNDLKSIPPPATGSGCRIANFGGWWWGATVQFYNAGSVPLYITH